MDLSYLRDRVRLYIPHPETVGDLSAVVFLPELGHLWVGSDEADAEDRNVLRRLTLDPHCRCSFGQCKTFFLKDLFVECNRADGEPFRDEDGEIDIEGIDYGDGYLWITGSHSSKRKKLKAKERGDFLRIKKGLDEIELETNRFLLARIPVDANGDLAKTDPHSDRRVACLSRTAHSNALLDALREDEFLGSIVSTDERDGKKFLSSKDNGLDIEGLAVTGDRLWIGLRGPVLRGIAILLEIAVAETEPGTLQLAPIDEDDGRPHRRHFVDLDGLGVRDLCWQGKDLLVLAGPTMDLDGPFRLYRLNKAAKLPDNTYSDRDEGHVDLLLELPSDRDADRAEGLTKFLAADGTLLVLYDSPAGWRLNLERGYKVADAIAL